MADTAPLKSIATPNLRLVWVCSSCEAVALANGPRAPRKVSLQAEGWRFYSHHVLCPRCPNV